MRLSPLMLAVHLTLAAAACAPAAKKPPSPTAVSPPPVATAREFRLGPGDVLEVMVWEDERLGREVLVRPDGAITLPLTGDIPAAGLTPMELQAVIAARVAAFAAEPHVSVIVKSISSYVLYVQGEVNAPGAYTLATPVNLVQLISLAGGFTEWADPAQVKILRAVADGSHLTVVNYQRIVDGREPSWMAPLESGDTVIVP